MINLEDKVIKLQIWGTAGQDRFRTITKTYYKGSQGVILAYDVCDTKSYDNVKNWIKQIELNAKSNICKALVRNKCDRSDRVIKEEDGKKLADEYNMAFYETSAKSGQNINEVFTYLTTEILKVSKTKDKDTNIVIHKKKRDKKHTGCCKK